MNDQNTGYKAKPYHYVFELIEGNPSDYHLTITPMKTKVFNLNFVPLKLVGETTVVTKNRVWPLKDIKKTYKNVTHYTIDFRNYGYDADGKEKYFKNFKLVIADHIKSVHVINAPEIQSIVMSPKTELTLEHKDKSMTTIIKQLVMQYDLGINTQETGNASKKAKTRPKGTITLLGDGSFSVKNFNIYGNIKNHAKIALGLIEGTVSNVHSTRGGDIYLESSTIQNDFIYENKDPIERVPEDFTKNVLAFNGVAFNGDVVIDGGINPVEHVQSDMSQFNGNTTLSSQKMHLFNTHFGIPEKQQKKDSDTNTDMAAASVSKSNVILNVPNTAVIHNIVIHSSIKHATFNTPTIQMRKVQSKAEIIIGPACHPIFYDTRIENTLKLSYGCVVNMEAQPKQSLDIQSLILDANAYFGDPSKKSIIHDTKVRLGFNSMLDIGGYRFMSPQNGMIDFDLKTQESTTPPIMTPKHK